MAVTLFFGIRLSGKPYERIAHKLDEAAYSTYKVEQLKKLLATDLLGSHSETPGPLELVYCGSVLDDTVELSKEGIKSGSTIHVFEKNEKQDTDATVITDDDVADASKAYRSVCFNSRPNNLFPKVIRPEVINKVLEKYPEFYSDTGAFAILRDAVLLEKMIHSYQARIIGDQYPVLIKSAKYVAETMINVMKKTPINPSQRIRTEDSSESSASENDSPQASPNQSDNQRISRNQLAAALLFAGRASLNSLSNIAQRSTDDEEMATTSNTTSSSRTPSLSAVVDPGTSSVPSTDNSQQYAAELQIMRDMGLTEDSSNLQALILCNGDVEAAITLVFGLGNFA